MLVVPELLTFNGIWLDQPGFRERILYASTTFWYYYLPLILISFRQLNKLSDLIYASTRSESIV